MVFLNISLGVPMVSLRSFLFFSYSFKPLRQPLSDAKERIPLVDDIEPPKDTDETDDKLSKQVKIATGASLVLTFVLLVLWPLPMHGAAGVFGKGGFTFWVVLQIGWALVGGIVIVTLPVYETVKSFKEAIKLKTDMMESYLVS